MSVHLVSQSGPWDLPYTLEHAQPSDICLLAPGVHYVTELENACRGLLLRSLDPINPAVIQATYEVYDGSVGQSFPTMRLGYKNTGDGTAGSDLRFENIHFLGIVECHGKRPQFVGCYWPDGCLKKWDKAWGGLVDACRFDPYPEQHNIYAHNTDDEGFVIRHCWLEPSPDQNAISIWGDAGAVNRTTIQECVTHGEILVGGNTPLGGKIIGCHGYLRMRGGGNCLFADNFTRMAELTDWQAGDVAVRNRFHQIGMLFGETWEKTCKIEDPSTDAVIEGNTHMTPTGADNNNLIHHTGSDEISLDDFQTQYPGLAVRDSMIAKPTGIETFKLGPWTATYDWDATPLTMSVA